MYGRKVKLRFLFILLILITLILTVFLVLKSIEENVVYFQSPTEIKALSELDKKRRAQLFEHISRYHQSFTTTADLESIDQSLLPHMTHLKVRSGKFSRL